MYCSLLFRNPAGILTGASLFKVAPLTCCLPQAVQALEGCCRDAVPIVIVMKAMGIESDQEVTQLIGNEGTYTGLFAPSLQECKQQSIFTQQQALEWLGESAQTSIHSFLHSFLRALTYSVILSVVHVLACSFTHPLAHSDSSVQSLMS